MQLRIVLLALALGAVIAGCGDDSRPGADAGPDMRAADTQPQDGGPRREGGVTLCTTSSECAGLVPPGSLPPCAELVCHGVSRRCTVVATDVDGDGHGQLCELPPLPDVAVERGDDCDDTNPRRFPGAMEDCDLEDDDCDLTTVGALDADGDGEPSSACCNLDDAALFGTGEVICGSDCADDDPAVHAIGTTDGPTERCNGVDDDCDGQTDLGCGCIADVPCGPVGLSTTPPSRCVLGVQRCVEGRLMPCEGAVYPRPETCEIERFDDDCDGSPNEEDACMCDDGRTRFYGGAPDGVHNDPPARCRAGRQTCVGGVWMVSETDVGPEPDELCDSDRVDDDCDGTRNEGCSCTAGAEQSCGGSPGGFNTLPSVCVVGTQRCDAGTWGPCTGAIDPGVEICDDAARDEDCDGTPNEGCECTPGLPAACGGGPVNSPPARCVLGRRACVDGRYGACEGSIEPAPEICNGLDDDCDGLLNEEPEASASCAAMGAAASCVMGACMVTACSPGLADCDANPATGCEVDTRTSTTHCGRCGNACDPGEPCIGGVCDPITSIAAGYAHTCAVRSSGRVVCWGWNAAGQLGNGASGSGAMSVAPVEVVGLTDAVEIAAGTWQTCARRTGGQVVCWGSHPRYCGPSETCPAELASLTPTAVGVSDAVDIECGGGILSGHSCAVRAGGAVACWGANGAGELGNGASGGPAYARSPVAVSGIATATRVATGLEHTCARLSSGNLMCWGSNYGGCLGDRSTTNRPLPVAVYDTFSAADVTCGIYFSCARMPAGGIVECWGNNDEGELGIGTTADSHEPALTSVSGAAQVDAGGLHACARLTTGQVRCWGANELGQLGDGRSGAGLFSSTPVDAAVSDGIAVAAGGSHTCALRADGTVACWGSNQSGELGSGTPGPGAFSATPRPVMGIP